MYHTRMTEWRFPREWTLEQFGAALALFVEDVKSMAAEDRVRLKSAVVDNALVITLDSGAVPARDGTCLECDLLKVLSNGLSITPGWFDRTSDGYIRCSHGKIAHYYRSRTTP